MIEETPLHQMDPTERFSDRSESYARYRPDYPASAIDAVFDGLEPRRVVIADLGAGTGISSRQFADRGAQVIAIEPNAAMRAAGGNHPRVEFRDGVGENTGLEHESIDVVTVFQAFHWFQPGRALDEIRRILVPGGRVAIGWNERDERDRFTNAYSELIREISGHHPAERRAALSEIPLESHGFIHSRRLAFPHTQRLDLEGLVGRARSTSYLPSEGPGHEELLLRLAELHEELREVDGFVRFAYVTTLCVARKR